MIKEVTGFSDKFRWYDKTADGWVDLPALTLMTTAEIAEAVPEAADRVYITREAELDFTDKTIAATLAVTREMLLDDSSGWRIFIDQQFELKAQWAIDHYKGAE